MIPSQKTMKVMIAIGLLSDLKKKVFWLQYLAKYKVL